MNTCWPAAASCASASPADATTINPAKMTVLISFSSIPMPLARLLCPMDCRLGPVHDLRMAFAAQTVNGPAADNQPGID
jgi:hypothetical protein